MITTKVCKEDGNLIREEQGQALIGVMHKGEVSSAFIVGGLNLPILLDLKKALNQAVDKEIKECICKLTGSESSIDDLLAAIKESK
jgi:mannose/fructose-specific phosphotransferase system component IIA